MSLIIALPRFLKGEGTKKYIEELEIEEHIEHIKRITTSYALFVVLLTVFTYNLQGRPSYANTRLIHPVYKCQSDTEGICVKKIKTIYIKGI